MARGQHRGRGREEGAVPAGDAWGKHWPSSSSLNHIEWQPEQGRWVLL